LKKEDVQLNSYDSIPVKQNNQKIDIKNNKHLLDFKQKKSINSYEKKAPLVPNIGNNSS
jgi:hypothetical protein